MQKSLKVLAALLAYPDEAIRDAVPDLRAALDADGRLPARQRAQLDTILERLQTGDLYDLQERYHLLFDRTRSLSLHLFEHVHGESRDRGQAMVDLARLYERHGLAIAASELPDYLPLFLEFLSEVPEETARELIADTAHILEAIRMRLEARKSVYASVFAGIGTLGGVRPAGCGAAATDAMADEDPLDLAALDAAWEDEPVEFGPGAGTSCKDKLIARMRAARRPAAAAN